MANTPSDDEIIEKRPSHPVATSCLILAAVTMLGGIIFQIAEISQVRAGMSNVERSANEPQKKLYEKNIKEFRDRAQKVVLENDHPEITGAADAADGKAAAATSETVPAEAATDEKAAPAAAPGKAAAPTAPPAEGAADEKPAEEKAEEKAPEPPAEEKATEPAPAEPAPAEPAPTGKAEGDAPAPEEPKPAGDEPKEEK